MSEPVSPRNRQRETISATTSKQITFLRGLSSAKNRKKTGCTRIEGPQALREALTYAPGGISDLYITNKAATQQTALVNQATNTPDLYIHTITQDVAHHVAPDAQGIIALGKTAALFKNASHLSAINDAPNAYALALVHTQDPGNMGNLIRLADASGAALVAVCAGGADVSSPKVIRMSVGSVFHIPFFHAPTFTDLVTAAHAANVRLLAADAHGSINLFEAGPYLRTCSHMWVMGNEAHGFINGELDACDHTVSIPILGKAESLNVATAGALCLYESARCRGGGIKKTPVI